MQTFASIPSKIKLQVQLGVGNKAGPDPTLTKPKKSAIPNKTLYNAAHDEKYRRQPGESSNNMKNAMDPPVQQPVVVHSLPARNENNSGSQYPARNPAQYREDINEAGSTGKQFSRRLSDGGK